MKSILTFLLLSMSICGQAQRFYATTFSQLPQSYQLYPRNQQNEALIPISGKIEEAGWSYFSVKLYRNKQAYDYRKAIINYDGSIGAFSITPFVIKAEKAEYDLKVYAIKGNDSLEVVSRTSIVAGDVYILTGQSNSTGFFNEERTNEYCRTFGKISGTFGIENYNAADTLWALSNQDKYAQGVGVLGFEFQELILQKYRIPTCLINGGFHWSSTLQHATRTANNPADLTNGYGRMLYRVQKAGVANAVKALIYRQGESEAYGEGIDFGGNFDKYYKNVKTDFPAIKQLYAYQIDIIDYATVEAPKVREIQRQLADKYPDIQVLASVGTVGFDGLHYTPQGYQQNARELATLVGRDFYASKETDNTDAPNVRKAYFSQKDKSEITLNFQVGQQVSWTEQYKNLLMKNFIYLDGKVGEVTAGKAFGNQIILTLKAPTTATTISYLPPAVASSSPDFPYTGPYIFNKNSLRALSFFEKKIEDYIAVLSPKVTFSTIPQNLQLFPRNSSNQAIINIKGKIETVGYTAVSMFTFRNNNVATYSKIALSYVNNAANFSFQSTIKAELAGYSFKIYAHQGTDSVLVTTRDNIVAGDVYIINGQSNAAAWNVGTGFANDSYRNEYCRTFGQAKEANQFIDTNDTTWAYSNATKPYVGVWGIQLQRKITEEYGIPTCVLNEAVLGSTIKDHNNRNANNPADINTIYGRLLYRAQKAGVVNAIKGFLFWQGESEAITMPLTWKSEYDKLYQYWQKDYPSVGKFYVFQINILPTPQFDAAEQREVQRQLKKSYAKTEIIATVGNAGYDGIHYSVDGYKQVANETFKLIARDFYQSTDTLQITAPNVQKIYYSTIAKDEITLIFEPNQTMLWTADSTMKQDDGTLRKYFMKDYFYLNNSVDKVISGRAEGNKIILKTTGWSFSQVLTYLPTYFPLNYAVDLRGIFGGPFLKNTRKVSAFSFQGQYIFDPVEVPTLTAKATGLTSIQLNWKQLQNVTGYALEVKDLKTGKFISLKLFPQASNTFILENLSVNTTYNFRIKAIADNMESEYSMVEIQTPAPINTPTLSAIIVSVDAINLSWKSVPNALNYVLERQNSTTEPFQQLTKLGAEVTRYDDQSLKTSTLYSYRLKAVGAFSESGYSTMSIQTPTLLSTPDLSVIVVYNNALKITWKSVFNSNSYLLERKIANGNYQIITTLSATVLEYSDDTALPNTSYSYRLKALGNLTESLYATVDAQTPALLATPEITIIPKGFDALQITWKAIKDAQAYVVEKKQNEGDLWQKIATLNNTQLSYVDEQLTEKTTYTYRLRALGDRTASNSVEGKGTTSIILSNTAEVNDIFILYPNPATELLTIKFKQPTTAAISIVDLRGSIVHQETIKMQSAISIPLTPYRSGNYVLTLKNESGVFSQHLTIIHP